jgi:thiosulfate/3-mercaptopyruvate sulfurtransferase
MSQLNETLPGIWFWEAPHPDWRNGDSWEQMVRCWALRSDDGIVLVDPLIRVDLDGDGAWASLDALAADHGPVKAVIRTLHSHHRSAALASARYDVAIYARPLPHDELPVHPFDIPTHDRHQLLGGLIAHNVEREDELVLWIPPARALLFSDVGQRRDGRFELCPEWWVQAPDRWSRLRAQLGDLAAELAPEHLLVCHGEHQVGDGGELAAAVTRAAARPLPPFISTEELSSRRQTAKLIDARLYLDGRSARDGYESAHLPGATFLDFEATLSDPPGDGAPGGRHPVPSPERFAAGLAAAGISSGDTVVAYDDAGGVIAARLVWLLRALGEDAALLSPVPDHWESTPEPLPAPGHFEPRPWPVERFASIDDVARRPAETVLLDARDGERFRGGPDTHDPRPGHIPGAINLPCRDNVGADGALVHPDTLWERFSAAGIEPDTEVISSCGSGVTACHTLLALEQVHARPGRLYVGSFSEWSRAPERPVATGD